MNKKKEFSARIILYLEMLIKECKKGNIKSLERRADNYETYDPITGELRKVVCLGESAMFYLVYPKKR